MQTSRLTSFLNGISSYYETNQVDGPLCCPKHKIEHTGRNAYFIHVNCTLFNQTKDLRYFNRAKRIALRTLNQVKKNTKGSGYIFWPGSCDPKNASMNVIDVGCGLDALATYYDIFSALLTDDEKKELKEKSRLVADSYVLETDIKKKKINQRLWCLSGFAKAYTTFYEPDEKIESFILDVLNYSIKEIHEDGSIFYESEPEHYGKITSSHDITPYYHSRHIAFIIQTFDELDKEIPKSVVKASEFLLALYRPNGIKEMNLECKKRYWMSSYEVASNSFDLYVFAKMYAFTQDEKYLHYTQVSFKQLEKHQHDEGFIQASLEKEENWQCPLFWSSHTAWVAKAYEELEKILTQKAKQIPINGVYPQAGLVRYETQTLSLMIRMQACPFNYDWGIIRGGASPVYFSTKEHSWENKLKISHTQFSTAHNLPLHGKRKRENIHMMEMIRGNIWWGRVEIKAGSFFFAIKNRIIGPVIFSLKDLLCGNNTLFVPAQLSEQTTTLLRFTGENDSYEKIYTLHESSVDLLVKTKKRQKKWTIR